MTRLDKLANAYLAYIMKSGLIKDKKRIIAVDAYKMGYLKAIKDIKKSEIQKN